MSFLVKIRFLPPVLLLPFCFILGLRSQARPAPTATEMQSLVALDRADIRREIVDPSSGARWLLVRSSDRAGGPGHLVLVSAQETAARVAGLSGIPAGDSYITAIRAGDRVVVEEHTGFADARLEAVALGPARTGARLRVRLNLGGRVVSAIASGPGHATLTAETEAWQ
jgi:hypothetical protein